MNVFYVASVFCFLYFAACGIYAGFGASYLFIWPILGAFLLAAGWYRKAVLSGSAPFVLPGIVKIAGLIVILAGVLVFLVLEGMIASDMFDRGKPGADYCIVLGCQVKGDRVSLALQNRLEAAEEYLRANPDSKAVLSGGQGPGENLTEAQAMFDWLTARGIEGDRLILEDRSTTTRENLIFSRQLIAEDRGEDPGDQTCDLAVCIITNNFHVHRGLLLAKKCGYTNAAGVAAKSHSLMQLHFLVREALALAKDMVR